MGGTGEEERRSRVQAGVHAHLKRREERGGGDRGMGWEEEHAATHT